MLFSFIHPNLHVQEHSQSMACPNTAKSISTFTLINVEDSVTLVQKNICDIARIRYDWDQTKYEIGK
jgi:hypothetical protein